jgi:hypothetical protein
MAMGIIGKDQKGETWNRAGEGRGISKLLLPAASGSFSAALSFLSLHFFTYSSKARQLDHHVLCYSKCYSMTDFSRHHCNLTCTSMSMIRMMCMMCLFHERNSSSSPSPNFHAKQP